MKQLTKLITFFLASITLSGCVDISLPSSTTISSDDSSSSSESASTSSNNESSTSSSDSSSTIISVASVSITNKLSSLYVGDTYTFKATVLPSNATDKSISYSSSNSKVATISNSGLVNALSEGSVTFTVKTKDGNKTDTCSIAVSKKDTTVRVTSVTLDKTSASLYLGETLSLTANVSPSNATNKNVSWSSSNTTVATVSNGVVTAISEGTSTITVKTSDGNKTASCLLTINSKPEGDVIKITSNNTSFKEDSNVSNPSFKYEGISSVTTSASYVYTSKDNAYRLTSSKNTGSITFTFNESITLNGLTLIAAGYNTKTSTVSIKTSSNKSASVSVSGDKNEYTCSSFSSISEEISSLTVSSPKGNQFYFYGLTLICKASEPIYPTSISLPSTLELGVNETQSLSVTYTPSDTNQKEVTWSSSNTTVATVSNGVVAAKAIGISTITAIAKDENNIDLSASCIVTVKKIDVASISLNKTSLDVTLNNSEILTVNFSPSNATNKEIEWSSNNPSIATVSDSGVVNGVAIGTTTIKATAKDNNELYATCEVNVVEQEVAAWTIMIYMCGSDLESGYDSSSNTYDNNYYLASSDIDEIFEAGSKPDNVNIIIQTGGASRWRSSNGYGISSSNIERWEVKNNKLNKVASLTDASMGASKTFQSFLEWGLTNYPATRTGVILWNHGGGMFGVCYDENHDYDSLRSNEVKTALANSFSNVGIQDKLEWIGYDACLMQVQDIAEFNSGYFNYMVASQESEAGYGWDYDVWLKALYANPKNITTSALLTSVVDSFIEDNGGVNYYGGDQTLSYLNLNKIADYKVAWENTAIELTSILKQSTSNVTSFNRIISKSTKHFGDTDYDYFCLFDAKHFLTLLQQNSTFKSVSYISATINALNEVVEYNVAQKSGAANAYGLSFFYLIDNSYNQNIFASNTYSNFTNWNALSKTYGAS